MATANLSLKAPIQFRTDLLERQIAEYAGVWRVTDNEAAKRLTALAATRLDVEQYSVLVSLSRCLAGKSSKLDFVKACNQVGIALDAANLARQQMGMAPLEGEERAKFIEKTVQDMVSKQSRVQVGTRP